MITPQISDKAFWDTDFSKINFEKNKSEIIERVFSYGTFNDCMEVIAAYGKETVAQTLLNAEWLNTIAIDFACAVFKLQPEHFKCYIRKPLRPHS